MAVVTTAPRSRRTSSHRKGDANEQAILETAALGFLGLGVQAPQPEWGSMLASARDYIERAPWVVMLPGLAILATVLAVNLMGDGLRDALDPKLRQAA